MIPQPERNGRISHGDVLVEENTFLPEPLRLEHDSTGGGWGRVGNHLDGNHVEKALAAVGWMCFYMAGAIRTTVFGFDEESMIHKAVAHLISTARLQRCNCLEIDDVAMHSFWGLPYVSVSAHSRHIQRGMVFGG
jgi:hypothetical protein